MPLKQPSSERLALIDRHYRMLSLHAGWNRAQFERLCRQLHCPPEELAALVGMKRFEMNSSLKRNQFPRPASIMMALLDQTLTWMQSGLSGPPIIPIHLIYPET